MAAITRMATLARAPRLTWIDSDRTTVARQAGLLLVGIAWLAYTRLYFVLHPLGLTLAPSLFMWATGKPDPLCGLTRTFAWMWQGDISRAAAVYPMGPVIFVTTFPALILLAGALATRKAPQLAMSRRSSQAVLALAGGALLANWALKLFWLGN